MIPVWKLVLIGVGAVALGMVPSVAHWLGWL